MKSYAYQTIFLGDLDQLAFACCQNFLCTDYKQKATKQSKIPINTKNWRLKM